MGASLFPRSYTQVIGTNGLKAAGAKVYFFDADTTTPRTTYSDAALSVPHAHPVVADANGIIPAIYLQYGDYRVRVTTSADVVLSDIDNIANPEPPDSGGGGGIVVSEEQIFQTGDVKWSPRTGDITGFVPLNGESIGSASSGATGRANPDTEDLYTFLWNNVDNAYCAVSTGRGASAAADFAANKTIALPDARGRTLFGLDDMGNTAANVAQVSTTISTTNASASATVASATGLALGMKVTSTNVPAGTTISAISGTTVTLSAPATGTAAGTAARFSTFADAQEPGATGGSQTHAMASTENATHTHIQDAHVHSYAAPGSASARGDTGSAVAVYVATLDATGSTGSTTATNQNSGDSRPHNNVPPGLLGGWYIKL